MYICPGCIESHQLPVYKATRKYDDIGVSQQVGASDSDKVCRPRAGPNK